MARLICQRGGIVADLDGKQSRLGRCGLVLAQTGSRVSLLS
jgi:hypothetical protein